MTQQIAVVVTTHDAFDHARANMEIIRGLWAGHLDDVMLVHAHNGPRAWHSYLEDRAVRIAPARSHYRGAGQLIDAGSSVVTTANREIRYVVYLAGDCWLYRPEVLTRIIRDMSAGTLRLAAAEFHAGGDAHGVRRAHGASEMLPGTGLTTDFFVLDLPWARDSGLIPLDFDAFLAAYGPLLDYLQEIVLLERYLEGRFLSAVRHDLTRCAWSKDALGSEGPRVARRALRLIHERPIDPLGRSAPAHKGHWPGLGLSTTEEPGIKRDELRDVEGIRCGPVLERLLTQADPTWFDRGAQS